MAPSHMLLSIGHVARHNEIAVATQNQELGVNMVVNVSFTSPHATGDVKERELIKSQKPEGKNCECGRGGAATHRHQCQHQLQQRAPANRQLKPLLVRLESGVWIKYQISSKRRGSNIHAVNIWSPVALLDQQ